MAGRHRFAGRALLPARRIQRATELVDARSQRVLGSERHCLSCRWWRVARA